MIGNETWSGAVGFEVPCRCASDQPVKRGQWPVAGSKIYICQASLNMVRGEFNSQSAVGNT